MKGFQMPPEGPSAATKAPPPLASGSAQAAAGVEELLYAKALDALDAPPASKGRLVAIGLGSFALFVVAAVVQSLVRSEVRGRPATSVVLLLIIAVALGLVLLLHELGHVAAMRALGWKVQRVLFVPFFGAVTEGDPGRLTPFRVALVAVSGPVLGTAAALLVAHLLDRLERGAGGPFIWMALAVNAFNLLPIPRLDGGRALEAALFWEGPGGQGKLLAAKLARGTRRLLDQPEGSLRAVFAQARRAEKARDPDAVASAMRETYERATRSEGSSGERWAAFGTWTFAVWALLAVAAGRYLS